jgi:hypothetical protein
MKETSWRTLMLMTTVLILVIIFEATVRPAKPKTPLIGPNMGGSRPVDCNRVQDKSSPNPELSLEDPNAKPAPIEPEPVQTVTEVRPAWLNDNLGNLNGTNWSSSLDSDDPNESSSEPEDPNEVSPPVRG